MWIYSFAGFILPKIPEKFYRSLPAEALQRGTVLGLCVGADRNYLIRVFRKQKSERLALVGAGGFEPPT